MLSSLSPQHQPIVDGLAPGRVEDGDSELMPAARSDDNTDAQEDAPAAPDAADSTSRDRDTAADDSVEHDVEEEAERPRGLRDPGMPSVTEIAEHDLTHIPARPWCKHCINGKGKDKHSLKLVGAYANNLVPQVRLDYCFLTENAETATALDPHGQAEAPPAGPSQTVFCHARVAMSKCVGVRRRTQRLFRGMGH